MTIIPVEVLDPSELVLLGTDLKECVRLDREEAAAARRSLAALVEEPADA